ncbi:hypothetical protein QFW96_02515 [Saccharopolyspora sp. TS4A08]|uniref:Uncharacterized protein n=1 Tax=Saccharopolyspora ipomoeae TaxID=3042027 RepID=A0ABT6PHK2_9PSEU|nr:hypothetical protein [Saccharopolyspora sp. TS4A08]MDI2027462.1 hypothetical protein [Saccharopolyspora sp. TS4A08]
MAVHPATHRSGFTTNITIDGDVHTDAVSLTELADGSIDRLRDSARSVSMSQRTEFGSEEVPGLTQVLRVVTEVAGTATELVQCQVYLAMSDIEDRHARAIIRLVLTAAEEDFSAVTPDFQRFVASVQPESSE